MTAAHNRGVANPRIDLLADHLELTERITAWHWAEWGGAYPESSVEKWVTILGSRAGRGPVPFTLIAWVEDEPVGVVSLAEHDMPSDPAYSELSPCVSGTFVLPTWRAKGIGSALMHALEARATSFGLTKLFLFTAGAERFYGQLGWRTVGWSEDHGAPVVVMERLLEH